MWPGLVLLAVSCGSTDQYVDSVGPIPALPLRIAGEPRDAQVQGGRRRALGKVCFGGTLGRSDRKAH